MAFHFSAIRFFRMKIKIKTFKNAIERKKKARRAQNPKIEKMKIFVWII